MKVSNALYFEQRMAARTIELAEHTDTPYSHDKMAEMACYSSAWLYAVSVMSESMPWPSRLDLL